MKHFFGLIAMVFLLAACNNSDGEGEGVGDSLTMDPTTAQPITTEPDTLALENDSLSVHQK